MSRFVPVLLIGGLVLSPPAGAAERTWRGVFTIMEDEPAELLKLLTNPWGDPGQGVVEENDTFSGQRCVKIIPLQRYTNQAGWELKIRAKPGPGEYRYLRFAWKSVGGSGIMVQLHDTDWSMRYFAGANVQGWQPAKSVAETTPEKWTVVTRDLYADWGERTLKGIALTAFNGEYALFDHIHLGQTIADLDRVDATGLVRGGVRLADSELDDLWKNLAGADARDAYRAKWTLVAAPQKAVPFLKARLPVTRQRVSVQQIERWISELDADSFAARNNARRMLEQHLDEASGALRRELERTASAEQRRRIERLLSPNGQPIPEHARQERAVRILELIDTPQSREWLAELAKGADGARLTVLAREALQAK